MEVTYADAVHSVAHSVDTPSLFSRYSLIELATIAGVIALAGIALFIWAYRSRACWVLGFVLASAFVQGFVPVGYISLAIIAWLAIGLAVVLRYARQYWDSWATLVAGLAICYLVAAVWSPTVGSVVHAVACLLATVGIYLLARATIHHDGGLRLPLMIASPFLLIESGLVLAFRIFPGVELAYLRDPIATFFSEPAVSDLFSTVPQNISDVDKAGGLLLNANTASLLLILGALLFAREAIMRSSPYFAIVSAIATVGVIATGSRSPLAIALVIGLSITWCLLIVRPVWMRLIVVVSSVAIVALGLAFLARLAPAATASLAATVQDRVILWRMAGDVLTSNPVLGLGFGGWADHISQFFYSYFPADRPYQEFPPHNLFLQSWVDAGIFAVVLTLMVCALPVMRSLRTLSSEVRQRQNTRTVLMAAIVVAGAMWPALHGLFDTTNFYGDNHTLPFYAVFATLSSLPAARLPRDGAGRIDSRMSISFVLPGLPRRPGGGHKVTYQLANVLAGYGHRITILHLRPHWRQDAEQSFPRRVVVRIYYAWKRHSRPTWFTLAPSVKVLNSASQNDADIGEPDVLVATSVRTAHFVSRNAERLSVGAIYLIQHYEDYSDSVDFVEETWRLPMTRVVVSGWLGTIADSRGLSHVLIRNGISEDEFPSGSPISDRPSRVLGLISDQAWKRADLYIDVVSLIRQVDPHVEAYAFGQRPRPNGLTADINYVENPSARELSELYQSARVYICTSDYEGFGLPVGEAMSSGTATVSTRNGGVEDFAAEFTLYSQIGDANGLAEDALALLQDDSYAQSRVDAAHIHIRGLSIESAGRSFEAVARGLIVADRSPGAREPA